MSLLSPASGRSTLLAPSSFLFSNENRPSVGVLGCKPNLGLSLDIVDAQQEWRIERTVSVVHWHNLHPVPAPIIARCSVCCKISMGYIYILFIGVIRQVRGKPPISVERDLRAEIGENA